MKTVLYSYSVTNRDTSTAAVSYISLGKVSNADNWVAMYIDDLTVTDTDLLVPINTAVAPWVFA